MSEITRTGPPTTQDGETWCVPLSGTPHEWTLLFMHTTEESPIAAPASVKFDRCVLRFRSREADVPHWIQYIDTWIASANALYRTTLAKKEHDRAERRQAEVDEKERVRQMNERFSDL